MKKIIIQFLILAIAFFGLWFALSQFHFTGYFKVKSLSRSTEEKLGNVMIDYLNKTEQQVDSDSVLTILKRIEGRICRYNNIDSSAIKLYVFRNKEVNAFALPGKKLILYSGIIGDSQNPEELSSVVAHEIAHMKHRHVIKKLTKEFGISMLMVLASSDAGTQIVKELLKVISSTSFDREMEREADSSATGYLIRAHIDPRHFSDFLFRISREKTGIPENFEWINTHPDTKERIAAIIKLRRNHVIQSLPVLSDADWHCLKRNAK